MKHALYYIINVFESMDIGKLYVTYSKQKSKTLVINYCPVRNFKQLCIAYV